jgi:alpha-tubulin suppressor-like RCC1 family protein
MWLPVRLLSRDAHRPLTRCLSLLMLTWLGGAAGCREDAESPVGPSPALDVTLAAAPLSFRQITVGGFPGVGEYHACAVTTDDRAYCWGRNTWGQLGIGGDFGGPDDCFGDPCSKRPVEVAGNLRWKHLSAGDRYTCGVTKDNVAYCWGRNYEGQLGDPAIFGLTTAPVKVTGGHTFRRIRTGVGHTCAITTSDVAFCWGFNQFGQVGDGTTTNRPSPVRVLGTQQWRDVEGDYGHTCGVTFDNTAYCWGRNFSGQLGDGTTKERLQPRAVTGGIAFRQIDAGWAHTCAVTTANLAYCWGGNSSGELGNNTTTGHPTPAPVSGTRLFETVSAGSSYTCGVTLGGKGFCWGANGVGQLGTGTTFPRFGPTAVGVGLTWSTIATNAASTCGVTTDHLAYCWGDNTDGELGDGTTTNHLLPTPVAGPM